MNIDHYAREAVRWGAENNIDDKVEIAKKAIEFTLEALAEIGVEDAL